MFDESVTVIRLAYIGALMLVFSILFYCAWHRRPGKQDPNIEDSGMGRDIAQSDSAAVPDAAIATNFQLLSVYPNVTFGIKGLVVIPFMNVLSFLLSNFVTLRWLEKLLSAISVYKTPHQYIAASHGTPKLRVYTAWVSFLVFTGVTCFEIVYLSRISKTIVGGGDASYYVLVAMLTISMVLVSIAGQQRVTLAADRWLLLIAYVGLHLAIGFMVTFVTPASLDITTLFVLVLLTVMIAFRYRQYNAADSNERWRHIVILTSTFVLLAVLFYYKVVAVNWSWPVLIAASQTLTPTGSGISAEVFFLAALTSFCPVIFYNFVDFSLWQKYLSEIRPNETAADLTSRVKKPFLVYVFESPLSWLLPVVLGLYAVGLISKTDAEVNPIGGILAFISLSGVFGHIVAVLFYAALVAVATSTACSYLVSTAYLFHTDLHHGPALAQRQSPKPLFVTGACMLFVLVPIDMLTNSIDQLIVLMLTCFAPLCALTPMVIWPIFKGSLQLKPWGRLGVHLTLWIPSVLGITIGVLAAIRDAGPDSLIFWASLPISFISAWVIYLFFVTFGAQPGRSGG